MKVADEKEVIVYSTPDWPWCHRTKEYLSKKGINFTEYDVAADKEKAMEMVKRTRQMGFNQGQLDKALSS